MEEDPLASFRGEGDSEAADDELGQARTLLLFEHGGRLYGVPAHSVDAVVAWQKPARLPVSVTGVAGVVQDRGRVVVVLTTPLGQPAEPRADQKRMVICATRRGFLGLPCEETREVGTVTLAHEPSAGELVDSSAGPVAFVQPDALVDALRAS